MNNLTKDALIKFEELLTNTNSHKVSGVFVMKSKETSKDFTYKIKGYNKKGKRIILIAIEVNYNEFHPICYIIDGKPKIKEFKGEIKSGAIWLLTQIWNKTFDRIFKYYELSHTGRCIKCNRLLTDAESIEFGMGKTCRS